MDSGLALRAPRNDEGVILRRVITEVITGDYVITVTVHLTLDCDLDPPEGRRIN